VSDDIITLEKDISVEGPTPKMKAHYAFDNFMVKSYAAFLLIAIVTLVVVVFGGVFIFLCVPDFKIPMLEAMWIAWLYMLDPSAHTGVLGPERIPGFFISLIGVGVMSMLMGFVVDIVCIQMEELRKGKSKVVETNHCLILGYSEKIFSICKELCNACETMEDGSVGGVVVVLTDVMERADMQGMLEDRIDDEARKGSKFVCRFGNPMIAADLGLVAVNAARSVIVLCDAEGESEKADAVVLRVVLTLCTELTYGEAHIVAEIRDTDSNPLLRLVGGDRVETVVSHDIVGRLMIMSVRQPGLSKVYEELLGFDGDEFYVKAWPEAVGYEFGVLGEKFPGAIVVGVLTTDDIVLMKPNMQRKVQPGEEIIVIAEDDDTYDWEPDNMCDNPPGPEVLPPKTNQEKILLIGWRRDVRDMLTLINDLSAPGSEINIFCSQPLEDRDQLLEDTGLNVEELRNVTLFHHVGHARRHIETMQIEDMTMCLVVSDESKEEDSMSSDSLCITQLLLVRDVQLQRNGMDGSHPSDYVVLSDKCPVLCEILDPRTESSIATSAALLMLADYVQSNEMVSRVLAMVAEERSVRNILDELLGGPGCGIEMQPAERYCSPGEVISFMQLSKRVHDVDEIVMGYQQRPIADVENTLVNPRDKDVAKCWDGKTLMIIRGQPLHPHLHD